MALPFTEEQFFAVFRAYNDAVWPLQAGLIVLAIVAVFLACRPTRWSDSAIAAILAVLWAWLAVAYHLLFFAAINPVAWVFAAVSLAGSAAFVWYGVRRELQFRFRRDARGYAGAGLIGFALVVYPLWSTVAGHPYPDMPTFGLPCPTTIFTIGLCSWLVPPHPRGPLLVPLLWCFVGAQGAILLGVIQDLGLVAAAVVALWLMVTAHPRAARHSGN